MAKITDIIQTERLTLRGIDETDADPIVTWRSDPAVYQYFKFPHRITPEEHLNWYHTRYLANENRFDFMCIETLSGKKAGVFGLIRSDDSAEISYLLAPEAQHKGYASEGIRALIRYAARGWKTKQITAEIHRENAPSLSLVRRLGFHLQKTDGDFLIYATEVNENDFYPG